MDKWELNEEQAKQMLETDPVEIEENNVPYDINLPKQERIKNAKKILNKK